MLLSAEKDGREVAPHAHYQRHGCYLAAWAPLATGGRASAKESRHTGNLSSPCVLSLSGEPELPRWLSSKECACQCRRHRRRGFHPWEGKSPWRRKWQPTTLFLPGWSHGQESGGLQSMGSQRVGQDWARNTHSLRGSQAFASPCCRSGPCQRLKQKLSEDGASILYENLTLREELNHLYLVGGEGWLRGHREGEKKNHKNVLV